jgi:uncharacterized protein (UPF0332 family)
MKFDWEKNHILAKEVSKIHTNTIDISIIDNEASFRCAINRAYYAAFCSSREYLEEFEELVPTKEDINNIHSWVINNFNSSDSLKRNIRQNLSSLRDWRRKVDYENNIVLRFQTTDLCVKWAGFVINDLQKLRSKSEP